MSIQGSYSAMAEHQASKRQAVYQLQRRQKDSAQWETIDETENIGKLYEKMLDDKKTPLPYFYQIIDRETGEVQD